MESRGPWNMVSYDDGIDRAIALVKAFQPTDEVDLYDYRYIESVFKVLIEALKAEKLDADI